jgi:drug/metabolite transporter (DMT)-like permease
MLARQNEEYLNLKSIIIVIILSLIWGFNWTAIKISNQGVSPIFASALRSIIASVCGVIYCIKTGEKLFHTDIRLFHGFIVGLLFGLQFACIYFGMLYTDAARSVVFVFLGPFVMTVGAHFFLKGDRLTFLKIFGLALAFSGILIVFNGKPKAAHTAILTGDLLEIIVAFLWGALTLYIKRFLAEKVHPINTFLYQLLFSIPILLIMSLILEHRFNNRIDLYIVASIFYQSVVVAFISYFIWLKLIHKYSVSKLSAFTLLTPIFGALFGIFFLGEEFTVSLMLGLPMVSIGIFFVNWKKRQFQTESFDKLLS